MNPLDIAATFATKNIVEDVSKAFTQHNHKKLIVNQFLTFLMRNLGLCNNPVELCTLCGQASFMAISGEGLHVLYRKFGYLNISI